MLRDKSLKHSSGGRHPRYEPLRRKGGPARVSAHGKTGRSKKILTPEPADRTLGYRYEMKYVISQAKALAIEKFVKLYLKMDHYSKLRDTGFYPVASLYLDSVDLSLCRESLEGHKNRFKLRVRSYDNIDDSYCFFEIKRRVNTIIMKSRARVEKNDAGSLLCNRYIHPSKGYMTDENTLRQFQLYMAGIGARPAVHIRYLRKAYEGDSDNRVRITFDHQLFYRTADNHELMLDGPGWQRHSLEGVILEIKFTGRYPYWLKQMAEYFCLNQRSMSKYASSIKTACSMRFCAPKMPITI